jgi:hypothetical protein
MTAFSKKEIDQKEREYQESSQTEQPAKPKEIVPSRRAGSTSRQQEVSMLFKSAAFIVLCFAIPFTSIACAAKATAVVTTVTICGSAVGIPDVLPPSGSGPVVLMAVPCFEAPDANASIIPVAYLRHVQLQPSRPSDGVWVQYDDSARRTMQDDYRRLWETGQLSELSIKMTDYTFPNGVIGKFITYTARERTPE